MEDRIRRILERVPGWKADECVLTPLIGGITNRNFKVERLGEAFVLRVCGEGTELLGIDRRNEHRTSVLAAAAGVGAEVVCFIDDENALVTRFIGGSQVSPEDASRPDVMRRVAESIRRCHEGFPFPGYFWAPEIVRQYHKLALARGVAFPGTLPRALELMAVIEHSLGDPPELVPCHNDLLAANFIDDGHTIRILDWEYAAQGDAFFDLGNFAVNQRLSEERCGLFLDFYLGRPARPADRARLELMKLISDLRESFWGFLQSGISKLDFDFKHYALDHLDRFLKNVAVPELPAWLKHVKE